MSASIEFKNVSKYYYETVGLEDVSFKVGTGVIHGLLGPNGAGKSTTMKIMTGLIDPTEGSVSYFEKEVKEPSRKLNIGYLPEVPPLYPNLTVIEYLSLCGNLKNVAQVRERIEVVSEQCRIQDVRGRLIKNLSKGYKQRVGLAQALISDPEILILDEPTSGLDPASIMDIRELILSLKGKKTIILSTHLLHEASLICDEISVIGNGKILRSGDLSSIFHDFHAQQVIRAKVRSWGEEKLLSLRNELGCEIHANKNGEGTKLTLYFNDTKEKRDEVSSWLVGHDCGLLYLDNEQPDLEEIFKHITSRQ